MDLPLIDGKKLVELVPMEVAIDALETAFKADTLPVAPQRSRLEVPSGELILMPAFGHQGVGVKLVTVNRGNLGRGLPLINGLYVLFDAGSLEPRLALDGAALTALRTGAVSGLATRHLASAAAKTLVIFGAGVQAHSHLEAMCTVRRVERVRVVSRTRERAQQLIERARLLGLDAEISGPESVAEADLICTCTTSSVPVFNGTMIAKGAHVNAVGAYSPDARELDDETVRRARLVVETREAAFAEAGDLLIPMEKGIISREAVVADLSELVKGALVRRRPEDITVFKSVGVAFEDLVIARAACERAER